VYDAVTGRSLTIPLNTPVAASGNRCGALIARVDPDHPAMIFNDNQVTYRQVNAAADRCGAALPQLGASAVDELCVRGPQVMMGYWNIPTGTANALRPDPDGGRPLAIQR
jgi:acyl-CoA synthetase (AMP-forming)/AMP-acid ligase II